MIPALYELLTGRQWLTVRSAAAEFGLPPGARWREQLSQLSDAELMARGHEVVAQLSASQRRERVCR